VLKRNQKAVESRNEKPMKVLIKARTLLFNGVINQCLQ
jgi:hypothetical protein